MAIDPSRAKDAPGQAAGKDWRPPLGRVGWSLTAALALLWTPAVRAQDSPPLPSGLPSGPILPSTQIIIRRQPVPIHQPSIIIVPSYPVPRPETSQIRVELDARGREWGTVYLNGRAVHRPSNFDRQKTLYLPPGGYRLEITGVVRSDLWASGYLDLGRDSSRLVVIRFSKAEGVSVSGSPYVWIPD